MEVMHEYKSYIDDWDNNASVRSKPRKLIIEEDLEGKLLYPTARQPILAHPIILKQSEEVRNYILIQSMYKYLNDIANIEKDVINNCCYKICKNRFNIKFPASVRQDALSIIIDESYHAYVALDFMMQVEDLTKIAAISLPEITSLSLTLGMLLEELPEQQRYNFELISICIAEHALTTDLIAVARSKEISRQFYFLMHDHVMDEARHASFFSNLLKNFWGALDNESHTILGSKLPKLIIGYFDPKIQKVFDRKILEETNELSEEEIEKIINDTHFEENSGVGDNNIIKNQMINLLKSAGVLDHQYTREQFELNSLI